jgi:hypothetical protein
MSNPYSNLILRTDKAVKELFDNLFVVAEDGTSHPVPCVWGNENDVVNSIINKDADNNLTIELPIVSVESTKLLADTETEYDRLEIDPAQITIRYEVAAHMMYKTDCNQVVEQVLLALAKPVYIDQLDGWKTRVTLYHVDFNLEASGPSQVGLSVKKSKMVVYAEVNFAPA